MTSPWRRTTAAATATVLLAALTACATAEAPTEQTPAPESGATLAPSEVTVTHAQGETTVPLTPQVVLTFDLASLDTLATLGVDVAGVPKSNLPGALAAYDTDEYLDIGTLFEPDYEAVNAAEPDLIIVAGRSAEALPELTKIAPTIDLSNDWADFRGSIETNAEVLGQIFDLEEDVAALVDQLDTDIRAAREVTAEAGTGLIVMTAGGEVTAYGPGSRFGFVHDELGLTPAVEDVEEATHGEAVSFEFLAETNPDWFVVVDRDAAIGESGAAAAQVLDNELVAQTTAWQDDQLYYADPVDWYIINGGLGTLSRIVASVTDALGGR
ncbi:siderophore ABC transporter substrate-binding protein [Actinotalea sp. K2]|uniref:siderophore ABC transporter substrate-binding protein n=1 Tax=Actinotalea sp. K2 TaxID=2939438 RepID=UPI002016B81F|nr:siderophore ABC transporter substrate-binding protein [Actinotalea sp. K2]MCL3861028.1 siderophore ABC transporter substrate-binding protein [Actinotalea sp. K2]